MLSRKGTGEGTGAAVVRASLKAKDPSLSFLALLCHLQGFGFIFFVCLPTGMNPLGAGAMSHLVPCGILSA